MENKVIIEGTLLSIPKLTEFNSTLFRVKNSRSFKKKDGTMAELTYTATISARGPVAQAVTERFNKGDNIRIEGNLTNKDTKKVDEEGNAIWQTWINAYKVDAMVEQQNLAPLPQNLGFVGTIETLRDGRDKIIVDASKFQTTQSTQKQNQAYQAVKQPTPIFKKQVNPSFAPVQESTRTFTISDEELDPFGDRLPF